MGLIKALRVLSRVVPVGIRTTLVRAVAEHVARHHLRGHRPQPGPPVIAGLFGSSIGLGEGARVLCRGLKDIGIDVRCIDLCKWFTAHHDQPLQLEEPAPDQTGGTLIVHLNPPELPLALALLGRRAVRNRRVVGFWLWELEALPRSWKRAFSLVDEIWVPSTFVARAFENLTDVPVRIVHYPLTELRGSALGRSHFGLPERAFVCFSAFDVRSSVARKNPAAVIRTFREAFGNDDTAVLVLKVGRLDLLPREQDWLRTEIAGSGNIRLISGSLSRADYSALLGSADVVLSLHRSEGFGLVPAEAMLMGKPVIATGWSGNTDFMTHDSSILLDYHLVPSCDPQGAYNLEQGRWAEPDTKQAASALRHLRDHPVARDELGRRARSRALEFYSLERFRNTILGCLAPTLAP